MYYNNKKLAVSILWVVLGTALLALSMAGKIDGPSYSGLGGALMAVGVLQVVRNVRYRTNEQFREAIDTQASDERNEFIRLKSWTLTGMVVIIGEAIGSVVAMVLGQRTLQLALSYNVCLMLVVYLVSYLYLSRKY